MFGAELTEFALFGKQFGLALAGAASLWGVVFVKRNKHGKQKEECLIFEWLASRLLIPLSIGLGTAIISWTVLLSILPVYAHGGISLVPSDMQIVDALKNTSFLFHLWIAVSIVGFVLKKTKPTTFYNQLDTFYGIQFVIIVLLMAIPAWTGEFGRAQLFFAGHSIHSIFTLGTVLILDFLFLLSASSVLLKQHIYPMFPTVSKVIWVGLGIDFASVALVFNGAVAITPKFLFMQTVLGILIINGVILAGPIGRKLVDSVKEHGEAMGRKWITIASVAGVISVVSWSTNTFVDSFQHLSLSYLQFLLIYIGLIVVLYLGHELIERLQKEPSFVPKEKV